MTTVTQIFDRYEAVRHRIPEARFDARTAEINSLMEITQHADAFVFDAFGVLNVGETPIPGAAERLDDLRATGKEIRILSNAASHDHAGAVTKFRKLGMRLSEEEIVTSRDATLSGLDDRLWGCIAAPSDDLSDIPFATLRLRDNLSEYDEVEGFLFLSTETWTSARQALLTRSILKSPRPLVIANADLAAPRENGFSLEPGHYGHLLADEGIRDIRFFGKPFPEVYQMIEASLPEVAPERIAMCGDTLHTDIIGAAALGWRTVLVTRDGLFSGHDTMTYCEASRIHPDWSLPRI